MVAASVHNLDKVKEAAHGFGALVSAILFLIFFISASVHNLDKVKEAAHGFGALASAMYSSKRDLCTLIKETYVL